MQIQAEQRAAQGIRDDGTQTPFKRFDQLLQPIAELPQRDEAAWAVEQQRLKQAERADQFERFIDVIGRRYADASLATWDFHGEPGDRKEQGIIIEQARVLAKNLGVHTKSGGNVILYGPPGTGKDHLLVALARVAMLNFGIGVQWVNGQDLYGHFRDRIDTDRSESWLVNLYCRLPVLAISDPVPPKGETSSYAANMLYRIVDYRYRNKLSTWVTVNVVNEQEAKEQLSAPVFDRLVDNCVALFCNWPSYRRNVRPQF